MAMPLPDTTPADIAEHDRARLADRLHDDFLQLATGLALQAKALEKAALARSASLPDEAAQLAAAANGLIRKMRGLIADLRATALERGLAAALRGFALDCASAGGVTLRLDLREPGAVRADVARALYRMAQEALTSAVGPREANQLAVSLRRCGRLVALRIADDGRAIDDPLCRLAATASLASLQRRAAALGAALRARPLPGGGIAVIILAHRQPPPAIHLPDPS